MAQHLISLENKLIVEDGKVVVNTTENFTRVLTDLVLHLKLGKS